MKERFSDILLKLIFPPKCIFCGKLLDLKASLSICGDCYKKIEFFREGKAEWTSRNKIIGGWCDKTVYACKYNGIIKYSIVKYKFFNRVHHFNTYASLLEERLKNLPEIDKIDMIISVPIHRKRMRIRGYNQSYLISRELSKKMKIPERSELLVRIKHSDNQSHIAGNMRFSNIYGAFKVTIPDAVKGKRILLIDDVLTTGSTVNECARVLKEAGAEYVIAAAVASGRK